MSAQSENDLMSLQGKQWITGMHFLVASSFWRCVVRRIGVLSELSFTACITRTTLFPFVVCQINEAVTAE